MYIPTYFFFFQILYLISMGKLVCTSDYTITESSTFQIYLKNRFPLAIICLTFGVSRKGFHFYKIVK